MRAKPNRPITEAEGTIVRIALIRASVVPHAADLIATIASLRVVDQCNCGCASVDFALRGEERPRPIADGVATTPAGGRVGVIVFGTTDAITGLEIYDHGAGEGDLKLPVPDSISPWS